MSNINKLEELRRRALELAEELSEEEKRLIKELASTSPNKYIYLGYAPIHLRGSIET